MLTQSFIKFALTLALSILLLTGMLQNTPLAHAAPDGLLFNVNDTADVVDKTPGDGICATKNNTCTLRAAIQEANAHPGTDIITLQANATYKLTRVGNDDTALNGDLDITEPLEIHGNHATVDGNGAVTGDRVFDIFSGSASSYFRDLIITGGNSQTGGGGIWNRGWLSIQYVTVTGNQAEVAGGGIRNDFNLEIDSSTISKNVSHLDGGGIWTTDDESVLTVRSSTIALNQANRHGGGIYAGGSGYNSYVFHSTIANNFADADRNHSGKGGGIFVKQGEIIVSNTLIANNLNTAPSFWKADDCSGKLNSLGYNLLRTTVNCTIDPTNNKLNVDPQLGVLSDNGGLTQTIPLKGNSPAIDAGNPNDCQDGQPLNPMLVDQRGYERIADGNRDTKPRCDIGAFEYVAKPASPCDLAVGQPIVQLIGVYDTQASFLYGAPCADHYQIVVRKDNQNGAIIEKTDNLLGHEYLTGKLAKNQQYVWRVKACNSKGCATSAWLSFMVKP